ncbi:hypothetical protein PBY51_005607 [Eleginops maclovinus]|uniref:Uncharacterized protein n=1 Tax=Eleginops maclovinus TaxID=56733 RepID=A0AAN7X762_ELEMC|nr:hypothetical protein PBY51_005607 [Eleginops maclovinus]
MAMRRFQARHSSPPHPRFLNACDGGRHGIHIVLSPLAEWFNTAADRPQRSVWEGRLLSLLQCFPWP